MTRSGIGCSWTTSVSATYLNLYEKDRDTHTAATMASELFSTEELFYGTTLSPLLLGLPLCRHFVIIILILNSCVILSMYP